MKSYLIFLAGTVTGSAIATWLIGWFLSSTPEKQPTRAATITALGDTWYSTNATLSSTPETTTTGDRRVSFRWPAT